MFSFPQLAHSLLRDFFAPDYNLLDCKHKPDWVFRELCLRKHFVLREFIQTLD
jgi:hypothetical protein